MKNNTIMIAIGVALVVGAAAFFGGMQYQKTKVSANTQSQRGQGNRQIGQNGQGRMGGGRPVIGSVLNLDDKSMTVKLQDGSSKIVLLPASVTISKTDTGTKTDLKVGENVGVFGTDNSDGSVTAQNVQLNPMFRLGFGGQGTSSPSAR